MLTLLAIADIMPLSCKSHNCFVTAFVALTWLHYKTDATAGFSTAHKDAATNLIWPIIADQVKTVHEWTTIVEGGACEPK